MQVSKIVVIAYLLGVCLSVHIQMNKREVNHHHHHAHHSHDASPGSENAKNNQNKISTTAAYLTDEELTIDITYGSKKVPSVIDTSSFISWVQSADVTAPTATQCIGCPDTSSTFSCSGDCSLKQPHSPLTGTYIQLQAATANAPTTVYSFGGLNQILGMVQAQEKSVEIAGLSLKNQQFGLGYKFGAPTNLNMLLKGTGQLGLAYGSDFESYESQKKNTFTPLTATTAKPYAEDSLNIVSQLHKQNPGLVSQREFSLKFEDNLNIISFGKPQGYFSGGNSKSFDNQGLRTWALKVSSFKLNDQDFGATVAVGATSHTTNEPLTLAVEFATATKFIWVSSNVATQLTSKIATATSQSCTSDNVIACACASESVIDKFPDIILQFNGESKHSFKLSKKQYAYYKKEDNKCYTYIQKLPDNTANTAANIDSFVFNGALTNPTTTPIAGTPIVDLIVLGTTFMKNYFITFNMDTNKITLSNPYPVIPDTIPINKNARTGILIAAALLFVASLAALLAILTKVKYTPTENNSAQKQQQPPKPSQNQMNQGSSVPNRTGAPFNMQPVSIPLQTSGYYVQGSPSRVVPAQALYRR